MIPARIAVAIVATSGWHALFLLAGRADGVGFTTSLALLAALGWALLHAGHRVRIEPLVAALLAIAVAGVTRVALVEIAVTVAALAWCAVPRLRWPVLVLVLLAIPVLPTFDMILAWPLRRISALLTVGLLRMNGIGVGLQGVALEWHGQQLLFDGPCSGVRMLWAMLVLTSLVAAIRRVPLLRFGMLLGSAVIVAIAGNTLRAASLFYVETGFLPMLKGPIMHEVVGLTAFAIAIAAALALPLWRRRSA